MSISWSSGMPIREGWIEIDNGVSVPREEIAEPPFINWKHIDGPLMTWAGQMHWLTWAQRLKLWLKINTPQQIAEEQWPRIARIKRVYRL